MITARIESTAYFLLYVLSAAALVMAANLAAVAADSALAASSRVAAELSPLALAKDHTQDFKP